ncbi:hypothetical protein HanPI659440_Chr03g0099041 [Helianthus annuus]|nr:hypothetical protein HanPI659440_Chr03g0099041 [Helianthus annuus]
MKHSCGIAVTRKKAKTGREGIVEVWVEDHDQLIMQSKIGCYISNPASFLKLLQSNSTILMFVSLY